MSRALGELVEEAQHGSLRSSVAFASCYARLLSDDARVSPAGPSNYFELDGSDDALHVPFLPLPPSGVYPAGRGWAFCAWLQLAPTAPTQPRGASLQHMSIARFYSGGAAGHEAELSLSPTDSPACTR